MKSVKKILAMCLAIMMIVSCIPAAHAADVPNTAIDLDAKGSLTLYKYDLTNAEKDGVWDSSYVSTGVYDETSTKRWASPNVPAIAITALILAMARSAMAMP